MNKCHHEIHLHSCRRTTDAILSRQNLEVYLSGPLKVCAETASLPYRGEILLEHSIGGRKSLRTRTVCVRGTRCLLKYPSPSSAEVKSGLSTWNTFLRPNIIKTLLNQFDQQPVFLLNKLGCLPPHPRVHRCATAAVCFRFLGRGGCVSGAFCVSVS